MARASSALLKRRLDIAEIVRKQGEVKVDELSELLCVSGVTIRQDLNYLEQQGYLKRSFGGAIYLQPKDVINKAQALSKIESYNHFLDIGLVMKCLSFIDDGDTIFLCNGPVTRKLIPYLYDKKNITLIVNDLNHAMLAKEYIQGEVILISGILADGYVIFDDNDIEAILSKYQLSVAIFEIESINSDDEIAISNLHLTPGYKLLLSNANKSIGLLPHRVIENDTFSFGELKQLDVIILSNPTMAEYHQQIINSLFKQNLVNKNNIVYLNMEGL